MAVARGDFMSAKNGHRKLTPQQRSLVKYLAKGFNLTEASLKAGYTPNAPTQAGAQALEAIRQKMPEVLERNGLSDDALIKKYLKPALEAKETKFFQFKGTVQEERDVIAWQPRLTALDIAFNLKGSYAPKQVEGKGMNTHVQINILNRIPRPDDGNSLNTSAS